MKLHGALTDFILSLAHRSDITADREPPRLIPDVGNGNMRPADVLLRGVEGRTIAIDVTVVNTLQQQHIQSASVTTGAACVIREGMKIAKYRAHLARNLIDFVPFAIESYGFIGSHARGMLDLFANRIARKDDEMLGKVKHRLMYELQTIVLRSVAQRIRSRQLRLDQDGRGRELLAIR
jgi:hypothetical protein